jgi:1-acyl-sn-glycerol-3-phosphate acyltransferase
MPRPTSIVERVARIARLTALLFRGLAICAFRFPRLTPAARADEVVRWSRRLMSILHIRVRTLDAPDAWPARCMVISNHVSWVDIFAILSVRHCVFVAKSEIRGWPFVGRLVAAVGTLFIERARKSHAKHTNGRIADALASGQVVAFCPEGTTSAGDELLKFHTALFQPAIDAQATLQPVALRYFDRRGEQSYAAAYVGETTLVDSIWAIASQPRMSVQLRFGAPIETAGRERRELARATHAAISRLLEIDRPRTASETPSGLPAAAR